MESGMLDVSIGVLEEGALSYGTDKSCNNTLVKKGIITMRRVEREQGWGWVKNAQIKVGCCGGLRRRRRRTPPFSHEALATALIQSRPSGL